MSQSRGLGPVDHNIHSGGGRLPALSTTFVHALEAGDGAEVDAVVGKAAPLIAELERSVLDARVLNGYTFNPERGDANPAFSPEEEEFARGGVFEKI